MKNLDEIILESLKLINYNRGEILNEELIRIKDYISSTNKTETERQFMSDFMFKHYGDLIPNYCDQNCLNRARRQVEELGLRLNQK